MKSESIKMSWGFIFFVGAMGACTSPAHAFTNDPIDLSSVQAIPRLEQFEKNMYRGGRPGMGDIEALQKQTGIKMVINLEHVQQVIDDEKRETADLGIKFVSDPMDSKTPPTDEGVNHVLQEMQSPQNLPLFVHCKHGEDRSGLIVGLYRVLVQKWAPADAYKEMLDNGFHPEYQPLDDYFRQRTGYKGH